MNEILKKRIEEAELAFADREYEVGEIDHDALCKGFFHGAEYALSHQWISVKEDLPENLKKVLVKGKNGKTGIAYLYQDKNPHTGKLSERRWSGQYKYITHWMPIPKLDAK